jgi:hypothetical protein
VRGELQRRKKPQQIRGLNRNHNHEMKEIFKGAAIRASCGSTPSMIDEIRWGEKAGLRRDAIRSQVIDTLEAQEIKETGNEKD